jgi:hypothetical protein
MSPASSAPASKATRTPPSNSYRSYTSSCASWRLPRWRCKLPDKLFGQPHLSTKRIFGWLTRTMSNAGIAAAVGLRGHGVELERTSPVHHEYRRRPTPQGKKAPGSREMDPLFQSQACCPQVTAYTRQEFEQRFLQVDPIHHYMCMQPEDAVSNLTWPLRHSISICITRCVTNGCCALHRSASRMALSYC